MTVVAVVVFVFLGVVGWKWEVDEMVPEYGLEIAARSVAAAQGVDIDIVGESGAAKSSKIDFNNSVFSYTVGLRHTIGGFEFNGVALAIAKTHTVGLKPHVEGHGQDGGGIKAAGEQHNSGSFYNSFRHWRLHRLAR